MIQNSLITYEGLPISSGGAHILRKGILQSLWAACEQFLHACTDYTTPSELHIVLHEGADVPRDFSQSVKMELRAWLGKPSRAHTISGVVEEFTNWWYPQSTSIPTLIDWFAARQPFPEHWLNMPLVLGVKARIRLRHTDGITILPYQDTKYYLEPVSYTHLTLPTTPYV